MKLKGPREIFDLKDIKVSYVSFRELLITLSMSLSYSTELTVSFALA